MRPGAGYINTVAVPPITALVLYPGDSSAVRGDSYLLKTSSRSENTQCLLGGAGLLISGERERL